MKPMALQNRAVADGVDEQELDDAFGNIPAIIELVMRKATAGSDSGMMPQRGAASAAAKRPLPAKEAPGKGKAGGGKRPRMSPQQEAEAFAASAGDSDELSDSDSDD